MARTLALDLDDIEIETLQFGDTSGGFGLEYLNQGMAMTEFGASFPCGPPWGVPGGFACCCCPCSCCCP